MQTIFFSLKIHLYLIHFYIFNTSIVDVFSLVHCERFSLEIFFQRIFFSKIWILKFLVFLFISGVGFVLRKIGNSVSPTVELKKDGDKYTLVTSSTFKNTEISFELGKEFDEETLDGRNVKSVITLEGNKLTQKQGGEPPSTIIREFTEKDMVATMTVGNVTCTRKYAAAE